MKLISHRGNLFGPQEQLENSPDYLNTALRQGFYIEIDVRIIEDRFYLGHDLPQYEISLDFLLNPKIYVHAKDLDTLAILIKNQVNCFFHDRDDGTLTSKGEIWTYPGKRLTEISIDVLPERRTRDWRTLLLSSPAIGICSDYVGEMV